MRAKFVAEASEVPVLRDEARAMRARAALCGGHRHLFRRARHLCAHADALEQRADHIASGARAQAAEQDMAPYVRAQKNLQKAQRHETSRLGVIEVESKQDNTLVHEYRAASGLEAPASRVSSKDQCPMCHNVLVMVQLRALLTCTTCGYATPHVDSTSNSMSYSDDMSFTSFAYKRQTHFEEWLRQLQAKESTIIDDNIIQDVMRVLHNKGVREAHVTHRLVRDALKELKYRKCYAYCSKITSRITGTPPPTLTPVIEERLRVMFVAVNAFFDKHAHGRVNMLSYPYCLYKFLQLLGLDKHLSCINLLKSKEKISKMDEVMKKIAAELGWEWIPT